MNYPNGGQVRLFGADNPDALRIRESEAACLLLPLKREVVRVSACHGAYR